MVTYIGPEGVLEQCPSDGAEVLLASQLLAELCQPGVGQVVDLAEEELDALAALRETATIGGAGLCPAAHAVVAGRGRGCRHGRRHAAAVGRRVARVGCVRELEIRGEEGQHT